MTPSLGLDHIYLRVNDLDETLAFFQRVLGLPLSWPMREEPFARYAWVNAGNVQLELWQASSNHDLPPGTPLPCVAGLALWPEDVYASQRALQAAGFCCKEPRVWRTVGASGEALNFTNCLVLDASAPVCQVFFCQWALGAPIAPWPKGESNAQRRVRLAIELAEAGRGAIGIVGLREIHMRSPDPCQTSRVWSAITGAPSVAAPGVALVLEAGAELRIEALVFGILNLPQAEAVLHRHGISGEYRKGVLWLATDQTLGLRLALSAD